MSRRNSPDRGKPQRSKDSRYSAPTPMDYPTDSFIPLAPRTTTGDLVPVAQSAPANLDPSTNSDKDDFLTNVKQEIEGYKARVKFVYDDWQRAKGTSEEAAKESDFNEAQGYFRNYLQGKSAEKAGDLETAYMALLASPADAQAAADALKAAEDAFYAKLELHDQGDKDTVDDFQDALANKGEIAPERLEAILETALGSRVTAKLSDHIKERIRTEQKLIDIVTNMMNEKRGEKIDTNDAFVNALVQTFQAAHDKDMARAAQQSQPNQQAATSSDAAPVSQWKQFSASTRYFASRPYIWVRTRKTWGEKFRERYENASPEERAKMERKANVIEAVGTIAVAAVYLGFRSHGFGLMENFGGGHSATPEDHGGANGHGADQNGGGTGGLTPEQFTAQSYKNEMDFLNTNNRVGNDFNNITANEIGVPGDKDHFPGYTALHDQYTKSPVELTAQVQQIQSIEQSNGHGFTVLNEFPRQPGESDSSYYARLGDAMHSNQGLHDHVTAATLDYVQQHGQSLQDLTQDYGSNYVVIENGKPVVKWADYVHSSDPNDKVIMLSSTKGIRFPCGQPIELIPVQQTVSAPTPVIPAERVVSIQPQTQQYTQEIVVQEQYVAPPQQYIPPPRRVPLPPPPREWHPQGKSTPRPLIPNNQELNRGRREGNNPFPVQRQHAPAQIPGSKPARSAVPAGGGSHQSGGSSTPGHRTTRH